MKKLLSTLAVVAVLLFSAAAVYADDETPETPDNGYGYGNGTCQMENFVDEDGDGVCDLMGSGAQMRGRANGQGQAAMQGQPRGNNQGQMQGQRKGGRQAGAAPQDGSAARLQLRDGSGQNFFGPFVDANGDGVCDNMGTLGGSYGQSR